MTMTNTGNAKAIGTWYNAVETYYCEDDNSHIPYTTAKRALACEVALRCELTCARPWTEQEIYDCLLYTSPSPRDGLLSRMPSSA